MSTAAPAHYSASKVQALLGIPRTVINAMVKAGFVTPSRGPRKTLGFTFQDLMLLRTAWSLQQAKIPPRKILSSLRKLKASLPEELPLTGVRITAVGADVAVGSPEGRWAAESGQRLMDFEVTAEGGSMAFIAPVVAEDPLNRANALLALGQALEAAQPDQAEAAYREALVWAPDHADVYLNLGAYLCTLGRSEEAAALYRQALARCADCAPLWFNQGLALEDLGHLVEAVAHYERCLAVDPTLIDAHYNAGIVLEKLGDARGALRHFSAYRRLSD